MRISKKFDRAFQWATEKIGVQEKTLHSDEFEQLETEMAIRSQGTDRLHKSITAFVKWLSRKGDNTDDGQKISAAQYLGRTLNLHGEDFEPESDYGRRLIALGRANERCATFQEKFSEMATTTWLESLVRSQAMMREYIAARKKLESRRISFDASTGKMQKLRRDDFRVEEELRAAKAKFEESCENVMRRMQDIKEGEDDSIRDLAAFLDAQLDFHSRCAEELRRVRNTWSTSIGRSTSSSTSSSSSSAFRPAFSLRGRSNTAPAFSNNRDKDGRKQGAVPADRESSPEASSSLEAARRLPGRPLKPLPDSPTRSVPAKSAPIKPFLARAATIQGSPAGQEDTAALTNIVAMRARAFNKLTPVVDENEEKGVRETNSTRRGVPPVPSRASKPEIPTRRLQVGY